MSVSTPRPASGPPRGRGGRSGAEEEEEKAAVAETDRSDRTLSPEKRRVRPSRRAAAVPPSSKRTKRRAGRPRGRGSGWWRPPRRGRRDSRMVVWWSQCFFSFLGLPRAESGAERSARRPPTHTPTFFFPVRSAHAPASFLAHPVRVDREPEHRLSSPLETCRCFSARARARTRAVGNGAGAAHAGGGVGGGGGGGRGAPQLASTALAYAPSHPRTRPPPSLPHTDTPAEQAPHVTTWL